MALKASFFKDKRIGMFAGLRERAQIIAITGAATGHELATVIKPYGVTVVRSSGSGGPHRLALPAPPGAGIQKRIVLSMATTQDLIVRNAGATGAGQVKFNGTTFGGVHFTTAAGSKAFRVLELVSVSTAAWQILGFNSTIAASKTWASTNSTK